MANETLKAQMVIPEVMKEMIAAKIAARNKIRRYAKVDNTLKGVPGTKSQSQAGTSSATQSMSTKAQQSV